ncbi:MAG: nitroreductase/quinone reductase family protein [Pseudomonadota bacterium]
MEGATIEPEVTQSLPSEKPPAWVNALVRTALHTPGLQALLGRHLAVLGVTGRRSGRVIKIPVTYARVGGEAILITQRIRPWWRNLLDQPSVTFRIAGKTLVAEARLVPGTEAPLELLVEYFKQVTPAAKKFEMATGDDGLPDEQEIDRIRPAIVMIRVPVADGQRSGR